MQYREKKETSQHGYLNSKAAIAVLFSFHSEMKVYMKSLSQKATFRVTKHYKCALKKKKSYHFEELGILT